MEALNNVIIKTELPDKLTAWINNRMDHKRLNVESLPVQKQISESFLWLCDGFLLYCMNETNARELSVVF